MNLLTAIFKVLYLNEHKEEVARRMSDTIQMAMRFNLYKNYMDSENYQVMNYGIGGTISGHVDSPGRSENRRNLSLPGKNF
jgi:hypothetical protein